VNSTQTADALLTHAVFLLREDFLPRLRTAVEQLSDERLWWKPNQHSNSVGNLILHLCGNVRQWIVAGVGGEPDRRQRGLEFSQDSPLDRAELLGRLESAVGEACQVLERFDRARINDMRHIQVYEVSVVQAVIHVVEHFSYHLGQVVYTTKMLADVDLKFYEGL
jgi:uncharacterized damage-inducible protein DinB